MELPPPPHPLMLPVLATATYLAALIAMWGFTSLALDTDVVVDKDASRLVGPSMAAAAALVVLLALRSLGGRASPWWTAVAASTLSYGAMLLAAADPEIGRTMTDEEIVDNLMTFITAGHETTALGLAWTFHLLALHPAIEARSSMRLAP